jgi:hypothetical protein
MPTLDEIVRQIEKLDGVQPIKKQHIHKRKDLNELTGILKNGEKIEKFAGGFYDNKPSTIVATDHRFLLLKMTVFSGVKVEEFPYDGIKSVEYNQGLIYGGLQLFLRDKRVEIKSISNALVQGIYNYIRNKIHTTERRETMEKERDEIKVSPTLDEIEGQIRTLDRTKRILKRKEIKELPSILRNGEKIKKIATGIYVGYEDLIAEHDTADGIIVATNQRVLFIDKSMFSGVNVKDYPYDIINFVKIDKSIFTPGLRIYFQGNRAIRIKAIKDALLQEIFDFIQSKIGSTEGKS